MSKLGNFFKKHILPKLSDNNFFVDKNGKPSSKRLGGLSLVLSSIIMALLTAFTVITIDTPLILGLATIGAGLLGMPKDQTV